MKCLFCDFINKKRNKSKDGYPFLPLYETRNTISFLSIDLPANEQGHTLVIPKKHFEFLEKIPDKVLRELAEHVKLTAKVIRKNHQGCNVLLNNGKYAEQYVKHLHFHVIPRGKGDGLKLVSWKEKRMSVQQFKNLSKKLRKGFRFSSQQQIYLLQKDS